MRSAHWHFGPAFGEAARRKGREIGIEGKGVEVGILLGILLVRTRAAALLGV
jgi:hypothetical protein